MSINDSSSATISAFPMTATDAASIPTSKDWILENFAAFEEALNGQATSSIHGIRKQALATYQKLGFPTVALEEWRYTDPKIIWNGKFENYKAVGIDTSNVQKTLDTVVSNIDSYKFVFVNGAIVEAATVKNKQVAVAPLSAVLKTNHPLHAKVSTYFGSIIKNDESFAAINTAFSQDGLVLFVEPSTVLDKPIELIFLTTAQAEGAALYPRIVCVLETGSSATVIERYINDTEEDKGRYLMNTVFECKVDKNAHFHHYRIQEESENAFHVSTIQGDVSSDATLKTHTFSFGGKLVRNHVNVVMNGSNTNVTMNGLSVLGNDQHVDNTTLLDHAMPHCESLELYKGIYGDKSQGVFSGTIIVREDAQKTNAIQSNRSVLLSQDAQVNTKPQLKIWADDVKCTHGATIGQLDEEALFYIQARGVGKKEAKMMLVQAFASEIVSGVGINELKEELQSTLEKKLDRITSNI